MIQVKNLYKTYDDGKEKFEALKDINVEISQGEIFGFIGLSGAGKTSLVRCISALETATSGEILIDDINIANIKGAELREARKKLGLVFQHFNLLMNSTVYENVAFPLIISKKPKDFIKKRVDELLEMVGLSDKRDSYPSKLSGGQKQRIGIARALAADPPIIICDEATSALDPTTTMSILHLIKDINKKLNKTFIVITHEMDVIKEICDKVAILEDGRIIESGNVVDVFVSPNSSTAKEFFKTAHTDFSNRAYEKALSTPGLILKITFIGDIAPDPFISHVIKNFDVEVSILSGNIQEINDVIIGCLIIKISGVDDAIKSSIEYFENANVVTEVVSNGI